RSQTVLASKRGSISQIPPAHSAQETTLMMPWTWCNGKHNRIRSSGDHSQASTNAVICALMFTWVVTTPLGRLVVPLVYRIMARRSPVIAGSAEATPGAGIGPHECPRPRLVLEGATLFSFA